MTTPSSPAAESDLKRAWRALVAHPAAGITETPGIINSYDASASYGGPIKRDRLWFFTAARRETANMPASFAQRGDSYLRTEKNARGETRILRFLFLSLFSRMKGRTGLIEQVCRGGRKRKERISFIDFSGTCLKSNVEGLTFSFRHLTFDFLSRKIFNNRRLTLTDSNT